MFQSGMELDRYRIVRFIRKGGMSEIYLAEDTRMPRQVAIKVVQASSTLYPDTQATQESSRLFQREMQLVSILDHPHILPLYDFGETSVDGTPITYMVMPYRPEGSLVDWLQRRGNTVPLASDNIADLIDQAADALYYAHEHQIVHLDVKPSNFLVRERTNIPDRPILLLADFGVAKAIATSKGSSTARGTIEYMAPEQWSGQAVPASDQYALAIMAYELLTGRVPFQGNMSQVMYQHLMAEPQAPSKINLRISPAIDSVLLRALSKKPEDRFPSIQHFAQTFPQVLQGIATDPGISVPRSSIPPPTATQREPIAVEDDEELVPTERVARLSSQLQETQLPPPLAMPFPVTQRAPKPELPPLPPMQPVTPVRKKNFSLVMLVVLLLLLISSGVIGFTTYQSNVNHANATATVGSFNALAAANENRTSIAQGNSTSTAYAAQHKADATRDARTLHDGLTATAHVEANATANANWNDNATASANQNVTATVIVQNNANAKATSAANDNANATATSAANDSANATATAITQNNTNATATSVANDNANATATAITQNNANATATSVANDNATATAIANQGTLVLSDSLSNNSSSSWEEGGNCGFDSGSYHAVEQTAGYLVHCLEHSYSFSRFAYQVDVSILQGYSGGMVFCFDNGTASYYYFSVSSEGTYALDLFSNGQHVKNFVRQKSSFINTGYSTKNTLAVKVVDGVISMYINGNYVYTVNDSTYSQGLIGVTAEATSQVTHVAFNNVKVWRY